MNQSSVEQSLEWLIENYFSAKERTLKLKKGECLFNKGDYNDHLYLVKTGQLNGYVDNPDGSRYARFEAGKNKFVGIVSFFSRTYIARANVIAQEDSEIAWITRDVDLISKDGCDSLFDQFMPVVVTDLAYRQQREQKFFLEKEAAMKQLLHSEKMASLGQMAAALAHELNNAIAVLERNTHWMRENITEILQKRYPQEYPYFQYGNENGRRLSSSEVRARTREIAKKFALARGDAQKLAKTGMPNDKLKYYVDILDSDADIIYMYWDIGATFHDMAIAAHHATHVVRSVRALGAQRHSRQIDMDVNQSIKESLALLGPRLDSVKLTQKLKQVPPLTANIGEFVQIWTNLIKNAIEAMMHASTPDPELTVRSEFARGRVNVYIQD
ncbi:MAG: hypothetical protein DWQ10_02365, partial [Calditrichaeota bacterium]